MKHVSRSQHKIYPSPWLNSHARLFLLFRERGSLGISSPQFRFAYDIPRGVRKLGRGSVRWLTEFEGRDESCETRSRRPPKIRRELYLYSFLPCVRLSFATQRIAGRFEEEDLTRFAMRRRKQNRAEDTEGRKSFTGKAIDRKLKKPRRGREARWLKRRNAR